MKAAILPSETTHYSNILHKISATAKGTSAERSRKCNERRHPVQRAPSRLYRPGAPPDKYRCPNTCIGPEFVVRALQPSKFVHLGDAKPTHRRKVVVILLNGHKLEIICDPHVTTAREIFETVVQMEELTENFTLGLAALLGGDFVFLRQDTRLSKVAPSSWSADTKKCPLPLLSFTLYLRVKFFLPSLRGIRSWSTKHLLYLQLRKNLLDQQIDCSMDQYLTLGGLALQAEFGDYVEKEHGSDDYFLLEHYVPEVLLQAKNESNLRAQLQKQHQQRQGLDPGRAEEIYISHVQTLPHYGCHFHSAVCVTKSGPSQVVWVAIRLQGIVLYQRTAGKPLLKSFLWCQLQNLSYSRHCFYLQTQGESTKYKLCMDHCKSFFVFHLASLHHQFFLKLRAQMRSLKPLSAEFGIPLKEDEKEADTSFTDKCSLKQPCTANVMAGFSLYTKHPQEENALNASSLHAAVLDKPKTVPDIDIEEYQNKENERPDPIQYFNSSTVESKESRVFRQPPRGVKMGTRAFLCMAQKELITLEKPHVQEDTMSLPSLSELSHTTASEAYVVNSSIKSSDESFHVDLQETLSESLIEKMDNISFEEERILHTVRLQRNDKGSLGVQISRGQDGGVYIHSVTPNGPAASNGTIHKGDQVVAVDGHNLLNVKYDDALQLLKSTGSEVEFVLSQACVPVKHNSTTYSKSLQNSHKHVKAESYEESAGMATSQCIKSEILRQTLGEVPPCEVYRDSATMMTVRHHQKEKSIPASISMPEKSNVAIRHVIASNEYDELCEEYEEFL